jgi:hypothetical protein
MAIGNDLRLRLALAFIQASRAFVCLNAAVVSE